MTITYEIILCDQYGTHLREIKDFYLLEWSWNANAVGALSLDLPIKYASYLRMPDAVIEINRHISGVVDEAPRAFFVRKYAKSQKGKRRALNLRGHDANGLLDRRITDYNAGTSYTNKTDYATDLIRSFVIENMGSSATDANRILNSAIFSVQSALGLGYSFNKQATRRNLLTTLQEVARTSYENGTAVYFDLVTVSVNPLVLQLRLFSPIRRVNRTSTGAQPLTLSIEDGQLTEIEVEYDWEDEINAVRAAGAGTGTARLTSLRTSTRQTASPWARSEALFSNPQLTMAGQLEAAGDAYLAQHRPRKRMTATLQQGASVVIGRDFYLGDKLSVVAPGLGEFERFDAYINSALFTVKRDRGEEAHVRLYTEAML